MALITIQSGQQVSVTLPAGQQMDITIGQGVATLSGGQGGAMPYQINGPDTIGPFPSDRVVTLNASTLMTYDIDRPLVPALMSPSQVAARAASGVAGLPASVLTDTQVAQTQALVSGGGIEMGARGPMTFCALGDSLTLGAEDATGRLIAYPGMLEAISKGKLRLLRNAGVFGERSDQILARVDSQVVAYAPNMCFLQGYTNDSNAGMAVTGAGSTVYYHSQIIAKLRAAGVTPVFIQAPPLITNAANRQSQERRNAALRAWNERNGVRHLTAWEFVTDPATGGYLSGLSPDNIHPQNTQYALMAQIVLDSLGIAPGAGNVFTSAIDAANLVTNGFFLSGSTMPTGWNDISGTNNATIAIAAPSGWAKTPLGNVLTISQSATATGIKTVRVLCAAAPNRAYRFSCRFKSKNCLANGFPYGVLLQSVNSGFAATNSYRPCFSWQNDLEGTIGGEFVTDATAAFVSVGLYGSAAGATGGSVDFAQVGLEDMTALGLFATQWPWV